MQDFRNLVVWQKAHQFTLDVYAATRSFPKEELFCLTSQARRACISIASNIAEGCGRGSDSDFARFLQMSMGSACEVEYQLLLAKDLGYMLEDSYLARANSVIEVKRMLTALIQKVRGDTGIPHF